MVSTIRHERDDRPHRPGAATHPGGVPGAEGRFARKAGGGRPCVSGVWGASLLMFLLVAMLNSAGAGPGLRMLLTGLVIIGVIVLGGSRTPQ